MKWWRLTSCEMGELWDSVHDSRYSGIFRVQYDPGENFWYVCGNRPEFDKLIDPLGRLAADLPVI